MMGNIFSSRKWISSNYVLGLSPGMQLHMMGNIFSSRKWISSNYVLVLSPSMQIFFALSSDFICPVVRFFLKSIFDIHLSKELCVFTVFISINYFFYKKD